MVVFLDYQNVYRRARDTFHDALDPSYCGQIIPVRLAQLIVARGLEPRTLHQVRVYRGQPDATRDPKGYGANSRQCAAWASDPLTEVVTRTLRYPQNWPTEREEEKGIDVTLAIDFVMMAIRNEYEAGVLMSTDTDLRPALEAVAGLEKTGGYPQAEVAAWSAPGGHSRRLAVPGMKLWCHWLDQADYHSVMDYRDYNVP